MSAATEQYGRSIAQYTGTRIDSSAKHIVQCRVNHDIFCKIFGIAEKRLTEDKYRYAMQKDELVLDVGRRSVSDSPDRFEDSEEKIAYPSVLTTLGDTIKPEVMNGIRLYYRGLTFTNEDLPITYSEATAKGTTLRRAFPYKFAFVGVSVGTAYASDLSGDNVGSVLVGGMATVLNGHFPCYTGELVQWYFDFEREEYDEEGFRSANPPDLGGMDNSLYVPNGGKEEWYQRRMFAVYREVNSGKYRVPLIKPYRPTRDPEGRRRNFVYGDRVRIVGRIVNGGQPWEPVDIFLSNTFV
eukprot:768373-Hanusia_phi.AAC.14